MDTGRTGDDGTSHHQDLAETLEELAAVCAGPEGFTLDELHQRLEERTWSLLLILLPLPFVTPLPMMGLSMPFGIAIAAVGAGVFLDRAPRVPARVRRMRCPPGFIARVFAATARLLSRLRHVVRPRWTWMADRRCMRAIAGAIVAISGILLALPLPIPFSNALPAYAILLTGIGLAQRDGLAVLAGQVTFIATIAFFALIAWGAMVGAAWLL